MEKTFEQAAPQPVIYEEDLAMVQHMIADHNYARDYFLNGDDIKLTSLSCAKVAKGAYTDLKKCTEEDIRTLMYEYFCWNNDSKKLESYKGTGKFKNWVKKAVMSSRLQVLRQHGISSPTQGDKGQLQARHLSPSSKDEGICGGPCGCSGAS